MDWIKKPFDEKLKKSLVSDKIPRILAELVAGRNTGITCKEDFPKYAGADIGHLEDPTTIPMMDKAVKSVMSSSSSAAVFGDYDADGVVSTYMMCRLLKGAGYKHIDWFIPDRITEGYGLNDTAVANFLERCSEAYDLIVALDCGSSSRGQIEEIKKQHPTAKIIVLDHHIISKDKFSENADAVLNPRMGDATLFCTGGVVYQFGRVLGEELGISPEALLPYAAITTVADVCDLIKSNRILVKNGLEAMGDCKDLGLSAIMEKGSIDPTKCTVRDISFGIGPMINAAGRMKHAGIALTSLFSPNYDMAKQMAAMLAEINEERKVLQNHTFDEALKKFHGHTGMSSALVYDKKWHTGVVGIVASKICEKFGVPAIVFGSADNKVKGSARSISGVHVKEIMDRCSHIFTRYGGHEMAAGATLRDDMLDQAWDIFDAEVTAYLKENGVSIGHKAMYDSEIDEITLRRLNGKFCDMLNSLGPFGHGNEKPIFRANNLHCKNVFPWRSGKGAFFKFNLLSLDCYGRTGDIDPMIMKDKHLDILFEIERNFTNKDKWAINIKHSQYSQAVG